LGKEWWSVESAYIEVEIYAEQDYVGLRPVIQTMYADLLEVGGISLVILIALLASYFGSRPHP